MKRRLAYSRTGKRRTAPSRGVSLAGQLANKPMYPVLAGTQPGRDRHPDRGSHLGDLPEVFRDLEKRGFVLARDRDRVAAELREIGPGHRSHYAEEQFNPQKLGIKPNFSSPVELTPACIRNEAGAPTFPFRRHPLSVAEMRPGTTKPVHGCSHENARSDQASSNTDTVHAAFLRLPCGRLRL